MSTTEDENEHEDEDELAGTDEDEGDEDEAGGGETVAFAVPADVSEAQASQDAIERMAKSLDLLTKHVARRMGEILGDAATDYEECEICNYWNTPGWRMKGPLPAAVEEVLRVALGGHALGDYKPDEYSRACEKCNGLGEVLTGSKVNGQATLPCYTCKGMGWLPIGNERASGAFAIPNGPAAQPTPAIAPAQAPAPDSPEIAAAKALLTGAGHMVIPAITVAQ